MIETSSSIASIAKALLKFQGTVDGVEKNKANPHFKARYANLEAVRDTAVPALQGVGIVYTQSPGPITDGNMSLTTMLIHAESGEWMKFTGEISLGKRDPQGVGSALTYMQRYSLMAALGLPPVDDDGESAMVREMPQKSSQRPVERPKTFNEYLTGISSSKSLGDAQVAFAVAWKSDLSGSDKESLKAAYEQRKAQLAEPNFDHLQP